MKSRLVDLLLALTFLLLLLALFAPKESIKSFFEKPKPSFLIRNTSFSETEGSQAYRYVTIQQDTLPNRSRYKDLSQKRGWKVATKSFDAFDVPVTSEQKARIISETKPELNPSVERSLNHAVTQVERAEAVRFESRPIFEDIPVTQQTPMAEKSIRNEATVLPEATSNHKSEFTFQEATPEVRQVVVPFQSFNSFEEVTYKDEASEVTHKTAALAFSLKEFNQKPLRLPLRNPSIFVDKRNRNLIVYDGDEEVRRYGISLGPNPEGKKEKQGDGKTPEGKYFISSKNDQSKFYLNLGISYPNIEDAEKGLQKGLIHESTYQRIAQAIQNHRQPPWNTALGGAIVIHGEDVTNGDWTQGCVGLRDEDMAELFEIIPVGTTIEIVW